MNAGKRLVIAFILVAISCSTQFAAADDAKLQSIGPITFGPNGILFVADPMAAKIYAFETGDTGSNDSVLKMNELVGSFIKSSSELGTEHPRTKEIQTQIEQVKKTLTVENINEKVAALMGANADQVRIVDLAVNSANGNCYLSVIRGGGEDAVPAIVKIVPGSDDSIQDVDVTGMKFTTAELPNPAESVQTRRGNQRMESITDLALIDGRVYIAGLSNEEFSSNLRSVAFPFDDVEDGTSIEIYHGAHGKYETHSPIRTFTAYEIGDEMNLLAAYTCTPLVAIPLEKLQSEEKVTGKTVAELGNRNRPLDMVVYRQNDRDYILMANDRRGVMKIDLADVESQIGIVERVSGGGTEGLKYETIDQLQGVSQLDQLGPQTAMIIMTKDSDQHLMPIILP